MLRDFPPKKIVFFLPKNPEKCSGPPDRVENGVENCSGPPDRVENGVENGVEKPDLELTDRVENGVENSHFSGKMG